MSNPKKELKDLTKRVEALENRDTEDSYITKGLIAVGWFCVGVLTIYLVRDLTC